MQAGATAGFTGGTRCASWRAPLWSLFPCCWQLWSQHLKYLTKLNIRPRSGSPTGAQPTVSGSCGCLLASGGERPSKTRPKTLLGVDWRRARGPGSGWDDWSTYLLGFAERLMNLTWRDLGAQIPPPFPKNVKKARWEEEREPAGLFFRHTLPPFQDQS